MSFIIEDEFGNHCFPKEEFKTFEDGWSIYNDDGTQDDQEDELDSYYVIENLTLN
jgi:hypothetical protein